MKQDADIKVLIADDSQITRTTLRTMLSVDSTASRAIYEASDGIDALAQYNAVKPDILLLDVYMPGMDGLEIIKAIRQEYDDQDRFIIVLTGADDPELQITTLNLGANDFLQKPFGRPEILARVAVAERQIALTRRLKHYSSRIHKEIELVASLQEKLLPSSAPRIPGVSIKQHYEPSGQASGDYFDYFSIRDDSTLRVVTADVSGHGARAAFIMGIVRTLFRISRTRYMPLDETVQLVNEHLIDIIGNEDDFVTVFAADIDFSKNSINYINAGHCPGMLKAEDGTIFRLEATAPLLGFFPMQPQVRQATFQWGSELFLFTDGLYDWQQEDGSLFDFSMFWELAATTMSTKENFLEILMEKLQGKALFSGGFRDDLTALWIATDA